MKLINISTKKYPNIFTMVDDADFDWLNQWKWGPLFLKRSVYVVRTVGKRRQTTSVRMHREIMGNPNGMIDHIDGNALNNQKSNLRICNNSQNMCNTMKIRGNKTSKFKGVCYLKKQKKFRSEIRKNRKTFFLGYFASEVEAAMAYNKAAIKYHGEFGRLNVLPAPTLFPEKRGSGRADGTCPEKIRPDRFRARLKA